MAVSNAKGWIVLTTGNKSEIATGYFTLYGDSAGGFAAIKDIAKTQVYELCRYRNARTGPGAGRAHPDARSWTSRRRPSCGPTSATTRAFRPTRCSTRCWRPTSSGTAPSPRWWPTGSTRTSSTGGPAGRRGRVQATPAAPGVRITAKAFGKDRRVPITNRYRADDAVADGRHR